MSERPGIMVYFDIRPALDMMSYEQKGILLDAMFDYAQHGVVPQLEGLCAMAWAFIKPKLDYDQERYDYKCLQAKHAVYSREEKRHNREPLPFEEWLTQVYQNVSNDSERYLPTSDDIEVYPTQNENHPQQQPSNPAPIGKSISPPASATERGGAQAVEAAFNDMRNARMALLEGYH